MKKAMVIMLVVLMAAFTFACSGAGSVAVTGMGMRQEVAR